MPRPAAVPQAGAAGPLVHLEGNVIGGSASVEVHQHLAAPLRPERVLLLGPRPPVLVGREDLLAEIGRRLARRPAADERPLVVAVHGLGGVGKTSLAAEYVHRHAAEYGVVCRLPAQDPAVLAVAFADLAVALGVRNDSTQNADPVKQVHAALADRATRWMLFLDNVEDPSHALRELIPPVGDGGVLVTSRSPDWPRDVGLEVDVLPVSDGAPLLLERSGDTDADAARAVAEALGGLPLALEQAAGYVRTSGRSLRAYRDLLASHRAELLARGRAYDYPGTLAATWDLALDRLRVEVPGSVALL